MWKKRSSKYINLCEIQNNLNEIKVVFPELNNQMLAQRDLITAELIDNLMCGYDYVDFLIRSNIDLFGNWNTNHILELNHLVLMGDDHKVRYEYQSHIRATQMHFFKQFPFIFKRYHKKYAKYNHWDEIKKKKKYKLAAWLFVYGVSQPQLFIEGNHRTWSLLMSYLLVRETRPPFVMCLHNIHKYLNPATIVKSSSKDKFFDKHYYQKKYKKYFAEFLEQDWDKRFLI